MFWNKKILPSPLRSDEYEDLVKKIVKVVGDYDIIFNRVTLLSSDLRKLRIELRLKAKEIEKLEEETSKSDESVYV